MKKSLRILILPLLALVIGGCEDQGEDLANVQKEVGTQSLTYYQHAKPIIDEKCSACHQPGDIAPFSLSTYDEVSVWGNMLKLVIEDNQMPPWPAADGCKEIAGSNALTPEDKKTLLKWIDDGMIEGDASNPAPPREVVKNGISRVDLTLTMPGYYTPQDYPDEYRCFLMKWPYDDVKYITGFQAQPGNKAIVHHIACYLIPPNLAGKAQAAAGDDWTKGYPCYGGPNISDNPLDPFVLIGVWGPGMITRDFPDETGLEVLPGSMVVLQVHYSTLNGTEPDMTAVEFKIDDEVEKKGAMLPYLDFEWVTQLSMEIPANDPDVKHSYLSDPTQNPVYTLYTNGVLQYGQPFRIYAANLHMHTFGKSSLARIVREDGTEECLVDIPEWDFHWQFFYNFAEPIDFYPGDELYLECHWDNSPGNQPEINGEILVPNDLNWGEGTVDEMCVGTFFVSGL